MNEKQAYTIREVAEMTGFSVRTVTRLFEHEPGILVIERPETRTKRRYRAIRIPRAVLDRVGRRLSAKVLTST